MEMVSSFSLAKPHPIPYTDRGLLKIAFQKKCGSANIRRQRQGSW